MDKTENPLLRLTMNFPLVICELLCPLRLTCGTLSHSNGHCSAFFLPTILRDKSMIYQTQFRQPDAEGWVTSGNFCQKRGQPSNSAPGHVNPGTAPWSRCYP